MVVVDSDECLMKVMDVIVVKVIQDVDFFLERTFFGKAQILPIDTFDCI